MNTVTKEQIIKLAESGFLMDIPDNNMCKWIGPDQEGLYNGSCGMREWMCIDGTPEENGMIYCHNCGRKIEHPVVQE